MPSPSPGPACGSASVVCRPPMANRSQFPHSVRVSRRRASLRLASRCTARIVLRVQTSTTPTAGADRPLIRKSPNCGAVLDLLYLLF